MDQSQFDGNAAPARTRTSGFLVALIVGLIVGGGLMALWEIYGSAPVKQPKADIAANASNETAQAIKDLQATQQNIVGQLEQEIAGQLQSLQQTVASEQAETKQLSDKVTVLSSKLDTLQQSFASAQQQPSAAPPPRQHLQKGDARSIWRWKGRRTRRRRNSSLTGMFGVSSHSGSFHDAQPACSRSMAATTSGRSNRNKSMLMVASGFRLESDSICSAKIRGASSIAEK